MVYVVIVYDVEADRTRRFLKLLRRYLVHVQNSVFEGDITEGTLEELQCQLQSMLNEGESIIVYEMSSEKWVDRTVYGEDPAEDSQFI